MYKIGDKEYNDNEVSETLWDIFKSLKDECHSLAVEYVGNHQRRKFYALHYRVDYGYNKVYACFSDEELEVIRQVYKEVEEVGKEEPFEDEEDRLDYISDCFSSVDIDYLCYIPDEDLHWAGGDPLLSRVDLEDWRKYCLFQVLTMNNSSDTPDICDINIAVSDDEYIKLLELSLFDPKLTFSDLKSLMPELYEKGQKMLDVNHIDYLIRMPMITKLADKLRKKQTSQQSVKQIFDNPFIGFIIRDMLKNKEQYIDKDPELWKMFSVLI